MSLIKSTVDEAVWQAFDHAAPSYDRVSVLQRQSADFLFQWMIAGDAFKFGSVFQWADIGTGTGALAKRLIEQQQQVFAIDQSPAMLAQLQSLVGIQTIQADMRDLPLLDGSMDHVVSHFALHWLEPSVLLELSRIVKSHGMLWLALPVLGSFATVSARYPQLPIFDFLAAEDWLQQVQSLDVELVSMTQKMWSQPFANLQELLHTLKLMGGHRLGRVREPVPPAQFRAWLRDHKPIALEYQVLYVQLRKR
ncbi:methyltransferase domain-containing protein [Aquirhabdus parva]|uniref:Methyltransferase domain-containing protein n=1 Tax=Aquirhabdus parva TaxID=2283318 RepID=A0A345P327_9GAMM|nr:methyltransferase domain-containing protein [Aquirhabdus parva]AXI01686.1 methyltransferase domain-containing protein [Aquirhabdus parva]